MFRNDYTSYFEEICRLAALKDKKSLKQYLDRNDLTINLCNQNITPVMKFALENKQEVVDFLMENFPVRVDHVIRGYARAGLTDQVDRLVQTYGYISEAIYGYAISGLTEQVEKLGNGKLEEIALRGYRESGYVEPALRGYAEGGHVEYVNEIIAILPVEIYAAMAFYAKSGYVDLVRDLQLKTEPRYANLDYSISGFAQAGLDEQVHRLLTEKNARHAVYGYARVGQFDKVAELSAQFGGRWEAVRGYAESGYMREALQLIQRYNSMFGLFTSDLHLDFSAVNGCVDNHMHSQLWKLKALNKNIMSNSSSWGTILCKHFKKKEALLRYLSFADNDIYRQTFAELARPYFDYDVNQILQDANKINGIMKMFDCGYNEAKENIARVNEHHAVVQKLDLPSAKLSASM